MQQTGESAFGHIGGGEEVKEEVSIDLFNLILYLVQYEMKLSVLEQEYMEKARVRQKEGIVKPQIVAGREFKGTAFISKPDKIIFKVS